LLIAKVGNLEEKSDSQFRSVHAQLTTLQKTSDNMDRMVARIPAIEDRLTALEADVAAIKVRLDNLGGLYEHLTKKVDVLYDEYYAMRAALERLEKRMDRQDAERLADRVQLLDQKVAALEKGALN
jgi:predicted nuclease with TOPRIM domain